MNKILIIQVNSADGSPSVTADQAKVILQGEVQDFWNWHFPVDYSDTTAITINTALSVQTIATHFWVLEHIINPYLLANPLENYDFFITLLPPKDYGWVGLTAALGYILISSPDPTKVPLIMAHEIGHSAYNLFHSKREFYSDCVYQAVLENGLDDIMGGVFNTLSAYQLNELGIVNLVTSTNALYWLNPVDEDKSGINFAPGYWIYQRSGSNMRIHLVKDGFRQMSKDILTTDQTYITDNGFQISWGQRVSSYIAQGCTSMCGFDLTTLNPNAIPVVVQPITNPCI